MPAGKTAVDPGLPRSRPTEAYWQHRPHAISSHQSSRLPRKASVAIIGSGITAVSVAHHLLQTRPDLDIVMLEARTVCSGATGRNGGHCKDVSFKTYNEMKQKHGRELAMRLARFRRSHVDITCQLARQLEQDGFGNGHFRNVESVTTVFDKAIFEDFKNNTKALLDDFPELRGRYSILDGDEARKRYGVLGACGVIVSPAAALWPYRLVTGVLQRLLSKHRNFSLEALTPVSSISASGESSQPYLVHTSRGIVQAQHVVHCTNGHASYLLPALRNIIVPVRGQMMAFQPSDSFPRLGDARSWSLCWSNGGFDYMTQADDAEGLVFLGGGVEQSAEAGVVDFDSVDDSSLNKPAVNHLCTVLPGHFTAGQGAKPKQAWTGIMGFTPDSFPLVGKVPKTMSPSNVAEGASGHEWIAAGFSGYGMVHCWQSGRALADMIYGRPKDPIDEYFPRELFECSQKRLNSMDVEDLRATFYKNTPTSMRNKMKESRL